MARQRRVDARLVVKNWKPMPQHGSYVGSAWDKRMYVAPMNADGSRSTDPLEWVQITAESESYAPIATEAARLLGITEPKLD